MPNPSCSHAKPHPTCPLCLSAMIDTPRVAVHGTTVKPAGGCGGCGKGPSLATKAVGFVKATVRHVAAGMPTVTDEEKARRLSICVVCPAFNAANATCGKCGCYVTVKSAMRLERCPIGKW